MKKFISFIVLFLIFSVSKADYGYLDLCEMVSKANYCALGTIVKIDNNYFYLKIEKHLFKKLAEDTIPIVKFENWSCGRRIEKYIVGQKELVFFNKSNELIEDYEYYGIGGGDEYELPIIKDTIRYRTSYNSFSNYNLNDFINVINEYYNLISKLDKQKANLKEQERSNFRLKSQIHDRILNCQENRLTYVISKNRNLKKEFQQPKITFGDTKDVKDTIYFDYHFKDAIPFVKNFQVLKYDYTITSKNQKQTYKVKSDRCSKELIDRLEKLSNEDVIEISNMFVANDKKQVIKLKYKKAIVVKK